MCAHEFKLKDDLCRVLLEASLRCSFYTGDLSKLLNFRCLCKLKEGLAQLKQVELLHSASCESHFVGLVAHKVEPV